MAFLCVVSESARAMPVFRYETEKAAFASYEMDMDGWAAMANDPIYRNSFDAVFSTRPVLDTGGFAPQSLQSIADPALSRHDRRAMRSLYESLSSTARGASEADILSSPVADGGDAFGGGSPTGNGDLLGTLNRSSDDLFAMAARDPRSATDAAMDDAEDMAETEASVSAGSTANPGEFPVIVIRPRATQADASLLDMPLGVLGSEAMKPVLRVTGMVSDTLSELRQYVLIEQPKSSLLMMMDNGSGQAIILQTNGNFIVNPNSRNRAANLGGLPVNADGSQAGGGDPAAVNFFNKPLKELLWDIVSSNAAIVLYFLLFACWIAWRYFISRHV